MSQERNNAGNVLSYTKLSNDQHLNADAESSAKNNLTTSKLNKPHNTLILIDKSLANIEINTTNKLSYAELITLLNSLTPESISDWFKWLKTNNSGFLDNYFYYTLAAIREKKIFPNIAIAELIAKQYLFIKDGESRLTQLYNNTGIREIEESKSVYKRYNQRKKANEINARLERTQKIEGTNQAGLKNNIEQEINNHKKLIHKFKSTISISKLAEFIILSAPVANKLQNFKNTNTYIGRIGLEINSADISNRKKLVEKKYTQKVRGLVTQLDTLSKEAKGSAENLVQDVIKEAHDPLKQFIIIRDHLIGNSIQFDPLSIINNANASTKNKFLSYVALLQLAKQGYREAAQYFKNHLKVKAKDISNPTEMVGCLVLNNKISLAECFNLLPTDTWKERVLDFALANYRIEHIKNQLVDILSKSNEVEINDYNEILKLAANKSSNRPSGSSFRLFVIPDFFLSRKDMIQKGIRKIAAVLDINKLINNINQLPVIEIQYKNEDSVTSEKAKLVTSQELIKTPLTPKADRAKGDIKSIKAELSSTVATDSRFRQALQKIAGFFRHLFGLKSTTVKASDENKVNLKIKETTTERSVKVK